MIHQFDQDIATKANKIEFIGLRNALEDKVTAQDIQRAEEALELKIEGFQEEMEGLGKTLDLLQQNMSESIYDAVKKANVKIQRSLEKKMAGGEERRNDGNYDT